MLDPGIPGSQIVCQPPQQVEEDWATLYERLRRYVEFVRKERSVYVRNVEPELHDWDAKGIDVEHLRTLSEEYGWPKFGHVAEIKSLLQHLPVRDNICKDPPNPLVRSGVINETVKLMSDAATFVPDDFMSFDHYLRVLVGMEWDSSPGFPYLYEHPHNRSFFGVVDGIPRVERVLYVWKIIQQRLLDRDSDPIRLFIKPEPHTKKKLKAEKYRLISSVSVVDQIIDQMIFGFQNEAFLKNNHYTPVRVGWGWIKGGWRSVQRAGMIACDKSSWDWSVSSWLVDIELEVRSRLLLGEQQYWRELAEFRYHELFVKNEFMTSGGVVFRVKEPGLMKSGCVNTIVSNSIMQVVLHARVSLELGERVYGIWAMGDDTIQIMPPFLEEYAKLMSRYCILKQVSADSEFAGFRWDGGFIEPLYPGKHAYNILHVAEKDLENFSLSYNLLYWRSRFRPYIRRIMPVPDIGFDQIWDGE